MSILFTHSHPSAYPENYHLVADVLQNGRFLRNWTNSRGCEVGVRYGVFSEYLLDKFSNLYMDCVDPYSAYQDVIDFQSQAEQDKTKENARERLSRFEWRVNWTYLNSLDAAQTFPRSFFDFVFIDANHSYEHVIKDIHTWHLKVKPNGLLCGHDYGMTGVNQAVNEFAEIFRYEVKHVTYPPDCWFIEVR